MAIRNASAEPLAHFRRILQKHDVYIPMNLGNLALCVWNESIRLDVLQLIDEIDWDWDLLQLRAPSWVAAASVLKSRLTSRI